MACCLIVEEVDSFKYHLRRLIINEKKKLEADEGMKTVIKKDLLEEGTDYVTRLIFGFL